MSVWPRLLAATVVSSALVALPVRPAAAQPANDQAEAFNNQGKAFLTATPMQAADAADRFQKAIDVDPAGRYYANLCLALYHVGKLGEALTACRQVKPHGGDERAVKQADNLMEKAIKPQMRAAGVDPDAPPPTDPGTGNPGNPGNPGTGNPGTTGNPGLANDARNFTVAPPPSLLDQKAAPKHEYTWTLGGQLFGASVAFGRSNYYDSSGAGFRITGDYLLMPKRSVGLVGLLAVTQVGQQLQAESLAVLDLGVGVYKDFCTGHLCLKPTLGAGLSLFQTQIMSQSGSNSLVGLSARAELTAGYAFGARFQHLITATIGGAGYTTPVGDYANPPSDYGLDQASSSVYVGFGYTHRFSTPFGSSPFFVLQ